VLVSALGRESTVSRTFPQSGPQPGAIYFQQTGHNMGGGLAKRWSRLLELDVTSCAREIAPGVLPLLPPFLITLPYNARQQTHKKTGQTNSWPVAPLLDTDQVPKYSPCVIAAICNCLS
jgi:hypothetical protein